ncbi:hypothetical protein [Thalassospira alkalitolerans]|uniref:Uncharacterized protein n=1 Tax=Thalassospira alkalitolerans TaxID=1293890 RepID=A0A1Y2L7L0_9PROT|nr:hypothetical protein [Thalassospira alkalitolerans]OSQ44050.1 hypothetical protein TALK_19560 [Thalassospira alkalitolerans]|tara:strand:- start:26472 stop:26663 length:192 start_codon:yes stop_codon:yes gene_type:complete
MAKFAALFDPANYIACAVPEFGKALNYNAGPTYDCRYWTAGNKAGILCFVGRISFAIYRNRDI